MTRETVRRARHILEIFAEAQGKARPLLGAKEANLIESVKRRKALDNAEQFKKRQADPAKRAACARRKRELRAAKLGRPVRAYNRKAAA